MKVLLRLAVAITVIGALSGLVPTPGPTLVPTADATTGWHTRSATWWFKTDFWTVKQSVTWQTTDPNAACRRGNASAEPSGQTHQTDVMSISRCVLSYADFHWYPVRNVQVSCWVESAFVYGVKIDSCGKMQDPFFPNSDASQSETVGSRYSVCLGPYQVLFGYCTGGWQSRLIIVGSMVRAWNNVG